MKPQEVLAIALEGSSDMTPERAAGQAEEIIATLAAYGWAIVPAATAKRIESLRATQARWVAKRRAAR